MVLQKEDVWERLKTESTWVTNARTPLFAAVAERQFRYVVGIWISGNMQVTTTVELENMFEPYRTSASTKMGLGLTLARTVIESHGGTISVREKADGGCCITLVLPRTF